MKKLQIDNTDVNVNISKDVISGIAMNTAKDVNGIAAITGKFTASDIKELYKKNVGNGVRIEYLDDGIVMDVFVVVEYGSNIPEIAKELQESVINAVSTMTGLNVLRVNVNVVGVSQPKDIKKK